MISKENSAMFPFYQEQHIMRQDNTSADLSFFTAQNGGGSFLQLPQAGFSQNHFNGNTHTMNIPTSNQPTGIHPVNAPAQFHNNNYLPQIRVKNINTMVDNAHVSMCLSPNSQHLMQKAPLIDSSLQGDGMLPVLRITQPDFEGSADVNNFTNFDQPPSSVWNNGPQLSSENVPVTTHPINPTLVTVAQQQSNIHQPIRPTLVTAAQQQSNIQQPIRPTLVTAAQQQSNIQHPIHPTLVTVAQQQLNIQMVNQTLVTAAHQQLNIHQFVVQPHSNIQQLANPTSVATAQPHSNIQQLANPTLETTGQPSADSTQNRWRPIAPAVPNAAHLASESASTTRSDSSKIPLFRFRQPVATGCRHSMPQAVPKPLGSYNTSEKRKPYPTKSYAQQSATTNKAAPAKPKNPKEVELASLLKSSPQVPQGNHPSSSNAMTPVIEGIIPATTLKTHRQVKPVANPTTLIVNCQTNERHTHVSNITVNKTVIVSSAKSLNNTSVIVSSSPSTPTNTSAANANRMQMTSNLRPRMTVLPEADRFLQERLTTPSTSSNSVNANVTKVNGFGPVQSIPETSARMPVPPQPDRPPPRAVPVSTSAPVPAIAENVPVNKSVPDSQVCANVAHSLLSTPPSANTTQTSKSSGPVVARSSSDTNATNRSTATDLLNQTPATILMQWKGLSVTKEKVRRKSAAEEKREADKDLRDKLRQHGTEITRISEPTEDDSTKDMESFLIRQITTRRKDSEPNKPSLAIRKGSENVETPKPDKCASASDSGRPSGQNLQAEALKIGLEPKLNLPAIDIQSETNSSCVVKDPPTDEGVSIFRRPGPRSKTKPDLPAYKKPGPKSRTMGVKSNNDTQSAPSQCEPPENSDDIRTSGPPKNNHEIRTSEPLENNHNIRASELTKNNHVIRAGDPPKNNQNIKASGLPKNNQNIKASGLPKNNQNIKASGPPKTNHEIRASEAPENDQEMKISEPPPSTSLPPPPVEKRSAKPARIDHKKLDILKGYVGESTNSSAQDTGSPRKKRKRSEHDSSDADETTPGSNHRRKLVKAMVVKNKNKERESLNLKAVKPPKEGSASNMTEKALPAVDSKVTLVVPTVTEADSSSGSLSIKEEAADAAPELLLPVTEWNIITSTSVEETDSSSSKIIKALNTKDSHRCVRCNVTVPTVSFWINVRTKELKCKGCLKLPKPAPELETLRETIRKKNKAIEKLKHKLKERKRKENERSPSRKVPTAPPKLAKPQAENKQKLADDIQRLIDHTHGLYELLLGSSGESE